MCRLVRVHPCVRTTFWPYPYWILQVLSFAGGGPPPCKLQRALGPPSFAGGVPPSPANYSTCSCWHTLSFSNCCRLLGVVPPPLQTTACPGPAVVCRGGPSPPCKLQHLCALITYNLFSDLRDSCPGHGVRRESCPGHGVRRESCPGHGVQRDLQGKFLTSQDALSGQASNFNLSYLCGVSGFLIITDMRNG